MGISAGFPPIEKGSGKAECCPVRDVLDRVSDKWSMLILLSLNPGTLRFTELKRAIGDLSQRMLSKSLRTLERDGYVSRKAYPTVPPKVEYSLTPLGKSLLKQMEPLVQWAVDNHDKVRKARKAYVPPEPIEVL
jgi:DNA-binding HxlR family transcriptional regulator